MIAQGIHVAKDTNLLCHSIFIINRLFQINQHYILGFKKKILPYLLRKIELKRWNTVSRKKNFLSLEALLRLMVKVFVGTILVCFSLKIIIESVGMWSALSFLKVKWGEKKAKLHLAEGKVKT